MQEKRVRYSTKFHYLCFLHSTLGRKIVEKLKKCVAVRLSALFLQGIDREKLIRHDIGGEAPFTRKEQTVRIIKRNAAWGEIRSFYVKITARAPFGVGIIPKSALLPPHLVANGGENFFASRARGVKKTA